MQNYKLFCSNKKIKYISIYAGNIDAADLITIEFDNSNEYFRLYAIGDCCSSSWFHFFDIETDQLNFNNNYKEYNYLMQKLNKFMTGKSIESIDIMDEVDLPSSGVQESDVNHLVRMKFTDGTNYDFVLRNSSNGYYDGWIEITIADAIFPPKTQQNNIP
ncbi:hypothetical protein QJ857_gp0017 [Tupanvirus soda lake]|uniref:Uncharacterized protein n=2 Tax=Tupanvirus TaxID=2094720 RepID=A0A6N1NSC7_9VIRU|nr:hypothetical protein QJ857_gp0017 [Tupanvirus soda lake]QKU34666.1 hypothetical protein [Tupanvirus soda lake]